MSSLPITCGVLTIHLGKQIEKLKKDFAEAQHQIGLLHQLHGSGVVQSRDRGPKAPQKRRWSEASYSEGNSPSGPPHKQAKVSLSGCSLEQIRDVLGGPDRGWGSMQYVSIFPWFSIPSFIAPY